MDRPEPLTEVEALKMRVLQLEGQLLDRVVKDWHAKVAELKTDIETPRPGWTFSPDTGQWSAKGQVNASTT